jgi:DNA-binding LytR/AlgR family response regulator
VDGFELDAVDYLVKPVSFERFFKAITKLNRLVIEETSNIAAKATPSSPSFIYLKVDRDMKKIFVNDIEYIEGCKDYVKVFFVNKKFFLVKQSISAMENLLSEHKFMRVHRSYLVSFDKISGYNSGSVQLCGHEIPIGRLYKQSVMERLAEKA